MSDNDKKLSKFTKDEMELLLHGKDKKFKAKFGDRSINLTYTGIIEKIERSYVRRDIKTLSERTQKAVMPYLKPRPCLWLVPNIRRIDSTKPSQTVYKRSTRCGQLKKQLTAANMWGFRCTGTPA